MGDPTKTSSSGVGQLGRLPMEVRRQIYSLSGLPCQEFLCLDAHVLGLSVRPPIYFIGRLAREENDSNSTNVGFGSLVALLLTCRQMCNEISVILYAENKFIVQDHRVLKFMRPTSMKYLKQLCILLYAVRGPKRRRIERNPHYPCHSHQLDPLSSKDHAILVDWQDTARHLAAHVVPGRLDLEVVCEIADHHYRATQLEHPTDLVAQALEGLPPLAALHLRLGVWPDAKLVEAARLIVRKHMAKEDEATPFRFMDLPQELRLEILRHTDLVTPPKCVLWDPDTGFRLSGGSVQGPHGQPNPPCRLTMGNVCFCTRFHAAWSPRCRCWEDPSALFLVSKQLTEHARLVFYNENVIRVLTAENNEASALSTTTFLTRGLLSDTLGYLRVLDLLSFDLSGMDTSRKVEEGWRRLRNDLLGRKVLNLRELTIHGLRQHLPAHETIAGTDSILTITRAYVNDLIWPLLQNGDEVRPFGTRRLVVELEHESDGSEMRYVAEEGKRPQSRDEEKWGSPVAAGATGGWREEVYLSQYV